MKNLIVKKLFYTVIADKESYEKAVKLEKGYPNFKFLLDHFELEIILNKVYLSEDEARAEVEPILKNWETYIDLVHERNEIRFKFSHAELIESELENDQGKRIISLTSKAVLSTSVSFKLITPRDKYPNPPNNFTLSPDVSTLIHRFNNSLDENEPITSMAYFCLTLIEYKAGSRKDAIIKFDIDEKVLRKIGELSSTRGDYTEARKINVHSKLVELNPKERSWLIQALKKIILRIGEYDLKPNGNFPRIEMNNLPSL